MSLAELISSTTKLHSLPDIYLRVQSIVDDPDSGMADLARVIGTDPGLTARLLRMANSAYFGMAMPVDTVAKAVNLLGMNQIHDLVLATSVVQAFTGIPPQVVDMAQFWRESLHCGVLARLLASACNVLDNERLFVAGLLHDIGHLLMYQGIPDEAMKAREAARHQGVPLYRAERAVMGFDHAQAGAALMTAWRFPPGLVEPTRHQLEPMNADRFPLECAIVHIAARHSHADSGAVAPQAWQLTGRSPEDMPALLSAAIHQMQQVSALIMPGQRQAA